MLINTINDFLNYFFYKLFENLFLIKSEKKNTLIINNLYLGDIISQIDFIHTYSKINGTHKTYFICRKEYSLFINRLLPELKIIPYDDKKYRFNVVFRFRFLRRINSLSLLKVMNLNQERGAHSEQIATLNTAVHRYCISGSEFYLRLFKEFYNKKYQKILCEGVYNEYKKINILYKYFNIPPVELTFKKFHKEIKNSLPAKYIVVAPFALNGNRDYDFQKFIKIFKFFIDKKFVLLGTKQQTNRIKYQLPDNVINLVGKTTLVDAFLITLQASMFIGLDSGLSHLAILARKKALLIIGGGNFGRFFPLETRENSILYFFYNLDCFNCRWNCIYEKKYCLEFIKTNDICKGIEILEQDNLLTN